MSDEKVLFAALCVLTALAFCFFISSLENLSANYEADKDRQLREIIRQEVHRAHLIPRKSA